jgi:hypothetical protein
MTRFLLLSDTCRYVDMGRPLWREDGPVIYNSCCLYERSHSQVRVPRSSWPHFTLSDLRLPQTWKTRSLYLYPQEQGGPVIPPGTRSTYWTGFPSTLTNPSPFTELTTTNSESHTHSFYRLSTDHIENTSSCVLLEAMFVVQLSSNKLQKCIHYCWRH